MGFREMHKRRNEKRERLAKAPPPYGGYYRWREMMDALDLWPEKRKEEWQERNLEE